MGDDDGLVASAVRIISVLTRKDTDLAGRALKIWETHHNLDASQCVAMARQERQKEKN